MAETTAVHVDMHLSHAGGNVQKEVENLRVWHADTVNELDKTRKLLQMQHTINKDYKAEVRPN